MKRDREEVTVEKVAIREGEAAVEDLTVEVGEEDMAGEEAEDTIVDPIEVMIADKTGIEVQHASKKAKK